MSQIVRDAFAAQARGCTKLGSPFMGRLMALASTGLTPGNPVADHLLTWNGNPRAEADSVPLRLAGALHALKRSGHPALTAVYPPNEADDETLWSTVAATLEAEAEFLLERLKSPPQTNEVRRAGALIPALHLLDRRYGLPIRLIEIGTSAGLNLRADRFRLETGMASFGPNDAPVRLTPDWQGPAPAPATPRVAERIGIDLRPLDPARDADRLLSYIWPDQSDRLALTEAAIALAARHPARLVASDAVDWLHHLVPQTGQLTLLFHTIAWQYLPEDARAEGDRLIAAAGALANETAPLARFAMEAAGPSAALTLQLWPGEVMLDLGQANYHGRWIEWALEQLPEANGNGT